MSGRILSFLIGSALALIGVFAFVIFDPDPSTRDLDADLATLREHIVRATAESEDYGAGLLKEMTKVRIETLRGTEVMLRQKRSALLRRINLSYSIEGKEKPLAS